MRNLLTILIVMFLSVSSHADLTSWLYGGPGLIQGEGQNEDITLRVGWVEDSLELGLSSSFYSMQEDPHIFGAYSLYSFAPIMISNPFPAQWLPAEIEVVPYLGGMISLDFLRDGRYIGPIAGIKILDSVFFETQYVEYDGDIAASDELKAVFGLQHRF